MTSNPHDALFVEAEHARGALRAAVAAVLADALDQQGFQEGESPPRVTPAGVAPARTALACEQCSEGEPRVNG